MTSKELYELADDLELLLPRLIKYLGEQAWQAAFNERLRENAKKQRKSA